MLTIYIELENTKYAMDGGRIPCIKTFVKFWNCVIKMSKNSQFQRFLKVSGRLNKKTTHLFGFEQKKLIVSNSYNHTSLLCTSFLIRHPEYIYGILKTFQARKL